MTILYLEHMTGDAALANDMLTKKGITCEVAAVSSRHSFITVLSAITPDIILSDDALPDLNSIDALILLQESGLKIPLISVTTPPSDNIAERIVGIMKHGAYDYISKTKIDTLPTAVTDAIKRHKAEQIVKRDLNQHLNTIDEVFFSRDMIRSELIQISPGCESVYGYSTAEFLHDPELYAKIYHPDDRHILAGFAGKLQNGETASGRYRVIHKNGSLIWIESKIVPVFDDNGQLIRIDGVSRNITKTKLDEDKLILSESRYRQIVESAQEGIWIIGEDLLTVFVNKKLCDMLEYEAEEIIGKYSYDFKDEAEKAITIERLKNKEPSVAETHESTFITKTGKQVCCIVITSGLFDNDGKYLGTLAMLTDITQRKADEDALRRSEANLSAVIENTTDLVYSLDSSFRFITFNQLFKHTAKHVYGFDITHGENIMDLLSELNTELAEKWHGVYQRAFNGETVQFVNEYPVDDGKVYLSYSVNPIWESGAVIGLSCFSRDITRQKLDEVAIKKSAANLKAIIENTDANIFSLDTDLNYITFNQLCHKGVLQAYGKRIKPGDNVLDALRATDPEGAIEWEGIYRKALTGQIIQFTKEFHFSDVPLFLNFSLNPIWENDAVIGLSCAARDITRQMADEIVVRKSEASLRTVFDNTDMACMLIDNCGKIVSFNTLAKKFSDDQGRTIREGYPILDWVYEDRRAIVANILNDAKNGKLINYQVCREINGIEKWLDMSWAGIKDDKNEDFGYILTIRDVTRQKKLEIEREKITSDLIQRNKALEQFTYIISHNLRAPVANIMGLSSLIDGIDIENEEIAEIAGGIGKSAHKLDEVISDLNQVLQVNEDINENIESISLPTLIDDIKFSIRHLVEKEHVRIRCDFAQASEMLSIKSFIHSIFYNLILNSIKFRNPGTAPVITISTKVGNGKICIAYKDNGRGIDTNKYGSELFGLYKRFDTSVEGKGMGMFMVKMQVESLSGTIALQSKLNQGTEFTLEFPQMHLQPA